MKVNISIDDVSPHQKASVKVLDRCFELIKIFPEIKFTLFIPIAYWRTIKPEITTAIPLRIDQFPDFCNVLKNLPSNNFEIAYHGLYHGIPKRSDNDEFQNLTYDEACQKFDSMFEIVQLAGLTEVFKPIFRPPAWRMSSHAIKSAKDKGIEILALSPEDYALSTYGGAQNTFGKVVYYNCSPPFKDLVEREKNEIVYHACEWDRNFLNVEQTKNLIEFFYRSKTIKFCFIDGLL